MTIASLLVVVIAPLYFKGLETLKGVVVTMVLVWELA